MPVILIHGQQVMANTYTTTGSYDYITTNASGCNDTLTLNLTIGTGRTYTCTGNSLRIVHMDKRVTATLIQQVALTIISQLVQADVRIQ
jgi:hypothetical protein